MLVVRPSGEWRYFSICVGSVLPPGTLRLVSTRLMPFSSRACASRSHSTAGLRVGNCSVSSSRFSMYSSALTSTGGNVVEAVVYARGMQALIQRLAVAVEQAEAGLVLFVIRQEQAEIAHPRHLAR